ncbi:RICIN domain-containing protein [Streptomyces virginiae]|uniref:RICIN domain-containing protein n=1 Tax=Streptomyces virginiae TaxID=1961 RepID=UPI0004C9850F|nr:RICIN domain-containing protein [Streptomyces virginiae]
MPIWSYSYCCQYGAGPPTLGLPLPSTAGAALLVQPPMPRTLGCGAVVVVPVSVHAWVRRPGLRACDGSAPSQKFLPRADGTIYNPVSGRCLDLGNADTTPGRQLWLWDCSGSDAQRWSVPVLGTAPLPVPAA